MADVITHFEPAWEERRQTEMQDLQNCVLRTASDDQRFIVFNSNPFPSLQSWQFGLIAKSNVAEAQLTALTALINEMCDGVVAHFDYQPEGLPYYDKDKWGLAIFDV